MPSPSKPPIEVLRLIERFDNNIESYRSGQYNETQVRLEFIDPFFKALGWDVHNEKGYAEAYKDVIHEISIKIGQATKAPDYCFRIGKTPKFFLEAKKPSVNLKEDLNPAFQLRRYAWSAKLPLSILSDFEEFAVYDCRLKPHKTDAASTARVKYLSYQEYENKWEELYATFSREAVLKGSFDKYAESSKRKRGTAAVDDAFLKEIEEWRSDLARTIALRNPKLSQRQLNFSVQRTIDRIIFLRICEDRGIELYGRLQALLNGENAYQRLCELFHRADERYNSGLFHFNKEKNRDEPPDELTLELSIDDKPLKDIIKGLYYPESAYEFSVLPADILGQVYEQFLGKVIRLTTGHRAVIEDKPEVKKAGGVYYTPTYIVDYIVKNTVGKLLNGAQLSSPLQGEVSRRSRGGGVEESIDPLRSKERIASPSTRETHRELSPKQASKLRILDPACGSGSFLIGAYQYLLDWHRDWYVNDGPEKHATGKKPALYQVSGGLPAGGSTKAGDWRLTTAERKRILLNNIYGVDIDPQAVEVTKLSLLLKVLEGESDQTLSSQLNLIHERALPDLSSNIKCGNSLIGPDFYDGQQLSLLDDEDRMRINVFDWKKEFPEILGTTSPLLPGEGEGEVGRGGFDAVIGNPPYIRMEGFKELKDYLKAKFECHDERSDLYSYFIEKAHLLLRKRGRFGMIVSNKFVRANYGSPLREFLFKHAAIERITDFAGLPVFKEATVRTLVLISSRERNEQIQTLYAAPPAPEEFHRLEGRSITVDEITEASAINISLRSSDGQGWTFADEKKSKFLSRLMGVGISLNDYCDGQICMGIKSGLTEAFVIDERIRNSLIKKNNAVKEIIKPLVNGKNIRRYLIDSSDNYLVYTYHGIGIDKYAAVKDYLKKYKEKLQKRATKQEWYELQQPQYRFVQFMEKPKIIFPDIAAEPRFALDEQGFYGSNTTYFIARRDLYLLGLLNSKVGKFYFQQVCAGLEGGGTVYLRFFGQYLEGFPVCTINFSDLADKSRHDKMVSLVERMLELNKQLAAAKTDHEKTALQRQIDATDNQIDRLVYELYELTEEEIKIVEGG